MCDCSQNPLTYLDREWRELHLFKPKYDGLINNTRRLNEKVQLKLYLFLKQIVHKCYGNRFSIYGSNN